MSIESYSSRKDAPRGDAASNQPSWLEQVKTEAFSRFDELGLPTTRHEEWKYTSTKVLSKLELAAATTPVVVEQEAIQAHLLRGASHRIVFVNGFFSPGLSSTKAPIAGLTLSSLSDSWDNDAVQTYYDSTHGLSGNEHAFACLNASYATDGAFVHIAKNVAVESPVEIVFVSLPHPEGRAIHPRLLVVAEANSQCTVVESHIGPEGEPYLSNSVGEFVILQGAQLEHYRIQKEALAGSHISNTRILQRRDSTYSNHAFSFGGGLVRNDINALLDGEGVTTTLNGLYLTDGVQHVDNHTSIDHAQPNSSSFQTYKGVLGGKSTGVFNGKVFVRQDAQRTDAKQSNKNLLMSPDATINTKPQLEIWADDVRCTHGATVGQLDPDALFYLQARGIDPATAKQMLTKAFANEVLDGLPNEAVQELLEGDLAQWLP